MASPGEGKGTVHWHRGCWEVLQRGPRCRQGCCPGSTTNKQVREVPVACDLTGKRAPQLRTSCWENEAWQCLMVQMPTVSLQCHLQIYRWLYILDWRPDLRSEYHQGCPVTAGRDPGVAEGVPHTPLLLFPVSHTSLPMPSTLITRVRCWGQDHCQKLPGCPVSHWHGQCPHPRQSGCKSKEHLFRLHLLPPLPQAPPSPVYGPSSWLLWREEASSPHRCISFPDSLFKNVQNRQNVLYINKKGESGSLLARAQAAWSLGLVQTRVSVAPAAQLPNGPWGPSMECALPCTLPLHLAGCGGEPDASETGCAAKSSCLGVLFHH